MSFLPNVLQLTQDDGSYVNAAATAEGHLETALHAPVLPFGAINTESLTPAFQSDAVYSLNPLLMEATTGRAIAGTSSATATVANNYYVCSTGTTSLSFATLQSRRRLRYHQGQGSVLRCAGRFTSPVANSYQLLGMGTAESGLYFGYVGTSFGVFHVTGGVREVHTFTVTTASTATNNYVVTLPNGTTVNVTATNNGSTVKTAYELSLGTYPGWDAEQIGSTVVFVASSAGPVTGTFSLAQTGAGTPAAGSDVETTAGVASTDTFIAQSSWNGDKLDGTGPSGYTIDPTKNNVFQIMLEYLGAGPIEFYVRVSLAGNNSDFVRVHTINVPNTRTSPSLSQPSMPFNMIAYSAGSTADLSVYCSSFAGFVVGPAVSLGPRMTYFGSGTSATGSYTPLVTIRNSRLYKGRPNQCVIRLFGIAAAAKSTNGLTGIFLIRNATLSAGTPNFAIYDTGSPTYTDTAATTCTFADNNQVQFAGYISESGQLNYAFSDREITIQPGETLTIAVRSVTATATVAVSLNTREDQ